MSLSTAFYYFPFTNEANALIVIDSIRDPSVGTHAEIKKGTLNVMAEKPLTKDVEKNIVDFINKPE